MHEYLCTYEYYKKISDVIQAWANNEDLPYVFNESESVFKVWGMYLKRWGEAEAF